jgi:hypothetical protein
MFVDFERFIRERPILLGVTSTTTEWYRRCLKWLPSPSPAQAELKDLVVRLREKGLTEAGGVAAFTAKVPSRPSKVAGSKRSLLCAVRIGLLLVRSCE